MPRKLVPIPKRSRSDEATHTIVFLIGGRRYALDFITTVRELRSEPARVIPFEPSRVATLR